MQHEEQNNKTLHAVARLATGGTQKCSENTHNCPQLLETPLVTFYRMGDQGRKRLRLVFQKSLLDLCNGTCFFLSFHCCSEGHVQFI